MNILVTGGGGQLGRAVARRGQAHGHHVAAPPAGELDIVDEAAIGRRLDATPFALAINAAAYTAVDRAETEPDRAFAINHHGAANLARACATRRVPVIHVSTDYVFDGTATRPYREDDPIAPLGVYGASKAAGEREVRSLGATVVRTSWLFADGGPSFVHTILRLAGERPVLRIVADQRGTPTWADDLADALIDLGERSADDRVPGDVLHYTGDGATTWHAFAVAIVDEARRHRALTCERIDAIATADYPTPARRPAYSVLDTGRIRGLGIVPRPWRTGMVAVVARALEGR